jgi:2-polyprenyl-3-methyl-5-hydroxy-6-metoxy-1,4-benzoquinol methylase
MSDLDTSIAYYDANAETYCEKTYRIDMSVLRNEFLRRLKPGARVIDVGSGSGRDSLGFLRAGCYVLAIDPSAGLAREAQRYVRSEGYTFNVIPIRAEDLSAVDEFDAAWCCASLVHHLWTEAARAIHAIMRAVKPDGYVFISVQEGDTIDELGDGRRMVRYTEDALRKLLKPYAGIVDVVYTEDRHPEKRDIRWISITARKYTR